MTWFKMTWFKMTWFKMTWIMTRASHAVTRI